MRPFKRKTRGSVSIEFTLGFLCLWLIMMLWVEVSYMSYVSSVSDLIVTQAVREAKVTDGNTDYMKVVNEVIDKSSSYWANVIEPSNFRITIQYLSSMSSLESVTNLCSIPTNQRSVTCGDPTDSPIAIYHVDYKFQPITKFFTFTSGLFSREMIAVQEYQRDKAQY
ncbi:pilus assembly protein [Vibrio sp. S4M6]|uniref:TadE/TadG family type IV pilus assembly protein n=1 Tax=Vibrio sinus TaxID=2946865 RepID=UPI00202A8614|nr:pilus assembly protein [Vibrio sinus]MCL9780808.1 pilus assembly protein [Vibrio sinus]